MCGGVKSLFLYAVIYVFFSFAIIWLGKRELVALSVLSSWCRVANIVLCLFLIVRLVREPAVLLIKWSRPKGLKVSSYVEKYAEFKN